MTANETVTLTREEYDALVERTAQLEDRLAASEAERDARVPHEVALAIMGGTSPIRASATTGGSPCTSSRGARASPSAISPRLSTASNLAPSRH